VTVGPSATGLADGVAIQPHAAFGARAQLIPVPPASRDAAVSLVPPLLLQAPELAEPYAFVAQRGQGADLSTLELTDLTGASRVTREEPLVIRVDRPLVAGEHVLPSAWDGEDHLPLGAARAAGDQTELVLTRLPLPSATDELTRGVAGSLKILFHKVVLSRLGADYSYPRLGLVTFGGDGEPSYEVDPDRVAAAVSRATRILLLVHGIIGDTRGMAAGVSRSGLADGYDALLAFDYESINTPVPTTASELASALRRIGLEPGHGKSLTVLAHSMGGLVSRWLIEREGGDTIADRLVLCGTPSGGSPWPRVEDLATASVGLALNGLSTLAGPFAIAVKAFGFAVAALEKLDVALDDMKPGSKLLADLAASPQPAIPYVAVAGDEPFGPDGDPARARRILEKLRLPAEVLANVFGGEHDVAVSVSSATTFGSEWQTRPPILDADCNHLTYFASENGVAAVRQALAGSAKR